MLAAPRQCIICGKLASFECLSCFGDHGTGLDSTAFCDECHHRVHNHVKRRNHKATSLKVPPVSCFMMTLEKRPVFTRVKPSWLVIEVISPKNKIAIAKKSTYKAVFHWAGKIPAKCNSLYLLYHLYQNSFRRIFRVV